MGAGAAIADVDVDRDRALVDAAKQGDLSAFAELYTRYFDRLTRFAQKRVTDRHEAEEIAQEAFTRAYRALPTFGGERRFYPWLTVITSRLCVDALRRRGRIVLANQLDREFVDVEFDCMEHQVEVEQVVKALGRLTDRHRNVLELREHRGWSYQHIADHLEVSLGTVETLLWRARQALRREYTSLGASLLGLPAVRRLVSRRHASAHLVPGALGSFAIATALTFGALPAGSPVPVTSDRADSVAAAGLRVTMSPPSAELIAPTLPAPPDRSSEGSRSTAADPAAPMITRRPLSSGSGGSQIPAIGPHFMGRDAAKANAESDPVVVVTPVAGIVVGVNPSAGIKKTLSITGGPR